MSAYGKATTSTTEVTSSEVDASDGGYDADDERDGEISNNRGSEGEDEWEGEMSCPWGLRRYNEGKGACIIAQLSDRNTARKCLTTFGMLGRGCLSPID